MSAIFLAIGIPMITLSNNIVDVTVDYDQQCFSSPCNVPFTISQKMVGPVFVYYELHQFFQNHRLYAKSVDFDQLKGSTISVDDVFKLKYVGRLIMQTDCHQCRCLQDHSY